MALYCTKLEFKFRSKVEVLLLLVLPIVCGSSLFVFVCYALLCVYSSFAIILKRKRKLVALLLLPYRCLVIVNVLWLFLKMPWVGLQCVIVVFPDRTHFLWLIKRQSGKL